VIDWSGIKVFSPDEFPVGEAEFISPEAMRRYVVARKITGIPWYPSKVPGATARFDGSKTSRHYAVGRLSDALDFFPSKDVSLPWFLHQLAGSGLFGGIGLYFDTTGYTHSSDVMFHVDCRNPVMGFPLVWFAEEDYEGQLKYTYITNACNYDKLIQYFRRLA